MRSRLVLLTVVMVLSLAVAALPVRGQEPEEPVISPQPCEEPGALTMWVWDEYWAEIIGNAIEQWTAEYCPGAEVDLQVQPWGQYWDLLATNAAGGELPDVFNMSQTYVHFYMENDVLLDLQPYFDDYGVDTGVWGSGLVDPYRDENGDLYAGPVNWDSIAIYYNKEMFDAAGLEYRTNARLVRGMDYYNLTVFEWVTERLGAQGTVCGGGRYDPLIEQLGGKPAPAVGWALGVERLLLLLAEAGVAPPAVAPRAYAVLGSPAALAPALPVVEALRAAGVSVLMHAAGKDGFGNLKSQFRRADASGAAWALIFGDDELARGEVALKALRARDGQAAGVQSTRALADCARWAHELLDDNRAL